MSPAVMSAVALAVIECTAATGASPVEARRAIETYATRIIASGRKTEQEVIELLTGPASQGPAAVMRWRRLLHDHGRPGLTLPRGRARVVEGAER